MKSFAITAKNIDSVIRSVKKQIKQSPPPKAMYIILPKSDKKLSKRYRGNGRPRKIDYDFEEIKWNGILSNL